jgi:uncharacterized protein
VLFVVVVAALIGCIAPLFKYFPHAHSAVGLLAWPAALSNAVLLTATLLATFVLTRWVDHRPWSDYGFPLPLAFGSKFWIGVAIGIGTLSVQLLLMKVIGVFELGAIQLQGPAVLKNALAWAGVFLIGAVFEQLLLRGYLQKTLSNGIGFWPAAVLLSCLFAALHLGNAGENKFGVANVVLAF